MSRRRIRPGPYLMALGLLTLLLGILPVSSAAIESCTTDDTSSESDSDLQVSPQDASAAESPTALNRAEIKSVCITETATATFVVVTLAAATGSDSVRSYEYTLTYTPQGGSATTLTHTISGDNQRAGAGTTSEGDKVQFTIAKSAVPVGKNLTQMSVEAQGSFPAAVTATDRAPDSGSMRDYTVGERAPATEDTDKDGVSDRQEVADKTDPAKADTDGDGLNDGAEKAAGSDPRVQDTDGDGLNDGAEVNTHKSSPTSDDTDSDGLKDGAEVNTHKTFPNDDDSDNDGLKDGDEIQRKTDPLKADTDGDGLKDGEEVAGRWTSTAGTGTFPPTDPTKSDSDGDGWSDGDEVRAATDPRDATSAPKSGSTASEVATYLPLSGAFLLLLVIVSLGGIIWRWG